MYVVAPFDGISGGQAALERCGGLSVDSYFASETNKYAIAIAQKNYPNTKQIGDVRSVKGKDLPQIDLMLGGSPCQGFSFAGKGLNFNDPRSALFFEFVRLLDEIKPTYFLLENVRMKKEYQDIITSYLGVQPILINSALVSAQNRNRLYWTNIPGVTQPEDRGIVLTDILDTNYDGVGNPCEIQWFNPKTYCHNVATATDIGHYNYGAIKRVYAETGKSPGLLASTGGNKEIKVLIVPEANKKGFAVIQDQDCFDLTAMRSETRRGRNMKYKSNCLTAEECAFMLHQNHRYRKLTPLEWERLQTLTDNYTEGLSKTQRYKTIANGWTIEVIRHILMFLDKPYNGSIKSYGMQTELFEL